VYINNGMGTGHVNRDIASDADEIHASVDSDVCYISTAICDTIPCLDLSTTRPLTGLQGR
jgi:hypothetical protein